VRQPVGKGKAGSEMSSLALPAPDETWMSLKTKLPHAAAAGAPTGVVNEKREIDCCATL